MSIKIPHIRKKISPTLLTLSAAIALLLLASPMLFSNILLLQPAQAQSSLSFRTTEPAEGSFECPSTGASTEATLTFDAQGSPSSSNPQRVDITNGTFQINSTTAAGGPGEVLYTGNTNKGQFENSRAVEEGIFSYSIQ